MSLCNYIRIYRAVLLLISTLCVFIRLAHGDLPIHALTSDVLGLWRVLETEKFHEKPQTCGGTLPNRNSENLKLDNYRHFLEDRYGDLKENVVELVDERYHRRGETPPRNRWLYLGIRDPKVGQGFIGKWTMVYDEGLDLDLGSTRYFGFFKYSKIDTATCPMVMEGSQEDSHGNVACYKTKASEIGIGWATRKIIKNGRPTYLYGCFYAEKIKQDDRHSYVLDETANVTLSKTKPSSNLWSKKEYTQFTDLSPFRFLQLHKGVSYKSIHHSHLSKNSTYNGNFVHRFLQEETPRLYACEKDIDPRDNYSELALPRQWSWGDAFNGDSDDFQTFGQGQCGSCYAMAGIYVLTKRIEILLRKLYPDIDWDGTRLPSVQDIIECSPFNQGCFGGFPFLVGKHLTELGVATETESPYRMFNGDGVTACSATEMDPTKRWYASSYGYVGGCYECTTELEIMREVYHHGPVAVAIDAPQSLFNYSSGVYDDEPTNHGTTCDIPLSNLNGWEYTNHAISIVGWGEEEIDGVNTKYWICRNTWGSSWGVGGYFKMKRGVNLCGIESQAVYIDPDLTRGIATNMVRLNAK
ncbi:preprocathepsin c precursor [Babesia ovis]|uniref:Dipeptidyl peptidase 1 n=1 Tax=Babesia ovis TaxID=5869 RepID=A0A9W5WTD1_BABOV|nr:preprocathepsin c precursor [Babesia ovis]